jgi:hypothetical protein
VLFEVFVSSRAMPSCRASRIRRAWYVVGGEEGTVTAADAGGEIRGPRGVVKVKGCCHTSMIIDGERRKKGREDRRTGQTVEM